MKQALLCGDTKRDELQQIAEENVGTEGPQTEGNCAANSSRTPL
jgi:hypothetical protein